MTTGKTISLEGSLLATFNILSRLVITFLPRSKCLLISWLQSAVPTTGLFLGIEAIRSLSAGMLQSLDTTSALQSLVHSSAHTEP